MRLSLLLIAAVTLGSPARAEWSVQGHETLELWPTGQMPDRAKWGPETIQTRVSKSGLAWHAVGAVSRPTLTVFPARAPNGIAMVVFPGGGYRVLAIDLEGTEICDWLVEKGVTCLLLKYRVPGETSPDEEILPQAKSGPYPQTREALDDAQRAIGLVRLHATQWRIDPHRVGVIGFSAGGHLVAAVSNHFRQRIYPRVDEADDLSCRPDFGVALYPGHLSLEPHPNALNPDIRPTKDTPPQFVLQAEDDPVDRVENALVYEAALRKAGVSVELHLYAHGGHAFGLRRTAQPITGWPKLVETWLRL